jgi:hypothetical protein
VLTVSAKQIAWFDPLSTSQWQVLELDSGNEMTSAITACKTIIATRSQTDERLGSSPVTLCLAPDITHHWLQQPPLQTQSLKELHAVANARAKTLLGQAQGHSDWGISAEWNASQMFLCTAVSPSVVALINAITLSPKKIVVVSVLALVIEKLKNIFPKDGWMVIFLADRFYLLYRQQGVNLSIRTSLLPEQASFKSREVLVSQEWQREMLRTQKFTDNLYWLNTCPDQSLPVSQTTQPQFLTLSWATSSHALMPCSMQASNQRLLTSALASAWLTRELIGRRYEF